ncbi:MAG: helicase-exonuclease AddAB subunit AddA [Lachnospiraceae bacterium]|nr:helicase-exonuclease AddAB subunit AddA [Lachnospiraceae bacterium]
MAVEFTPEQKQVIELHNCNILVSAAAGSGKTAVLTERIVQMVCRKENPVDIDRLLVVTFTNAAAAEMRERISQAIADRLEADGENEHLQKQAALLHNAQITTIDSFCLFVLRNNFQDIGLDPGFRVTDEGELELLKQEALSELLEEKFAEGTEAFYKCVEYYCPGSRETALEEHILELYRYALSYPFPEEWLEERKKDYVLESIEDIEKSEWGQYLLNHLQKTVKSLYQELVSAKVLCEQPDGPYMYGELIEEEAEQLLKIAEEDALVRFAEKLPAVTFGRLSSKKDDSVSTAKREQAKDIRDGVKASVKKLCEQYFSLPFESVLRRSGECAQVISELVDLCLAFKVRLDEKKREKKMLDFSDMEHMVLEILIKKDDKGNIVPTETALEYQDYFEEVLIDEYQDSNLVQEYLLKAVSKENADVPNRFMVGDVKQSIYKFRLARPELFLEKYHTYSIQEGRLRRIDLHKNFRSRTEVIDTVNMVFEKIMRADLGGIVYDESAALYAGAVYPQNAGNESELLLIEKPSKDAEWNAKQVEALGIAKRIHRLKKEFLVTDKATGKLRPVMYKDMVILLRTNSGWDEEFKEVLAAEGIPAYVAGRTGYFATKEIQDVLQFLRVLDNPLQDIPLFGVMKSVFGQFTDEEAAVIKSRGENRDTCLYDCLRICAGVQERAGRGEVSVILEPTMQAAVTLDSGEKYCDTGLQEKCREFLNKLAEYRQCTSYMTILELLKKIFADFDYPAYVAALPAGGKRLANVEMLLIKAAGFEKNSYYGLFHFVRYMEQLEKYNVDYGEAGTLDENADVVRIMSIHKSKGLEFPVAFVAGLSKRFNMQDTSKALIVDTDLGLGTEYVNPDLRIKGKTLRKNVLATKMKLDNLAEELRVLYVALTRAREKLIMTAAAEDLENTITKAELLRQSGEISYAALTGAGNFLDLLLPTVPLVIPVSAEELTLEDLKEGVEEAGRRYELKEAGAYADKPALEMLTERFMYRYPHKNLENLYTKTTVSELKKAAMEGKGEEPAKEMFPAEEITPYIPAFMREKESVSGTTRGSAMHRIMELLDFTRSGWDVSKITEMMEVFCEEGRLSGEYKEAIRVQKVADFMNAPLAKRMQQAAKAGKLFREQPFVYGIPADRLSFPTDETVLIQGIVDVFFEEEDGLVLLDYKTDVIKRPEELIQRYKTQLDYYEEALESITGKKVKERILYSFYLGCEVAVEK